MNEKMIKWAGHLW